jgi:hypothetical protein
MFRIALNDFASYGIHRHAIAPAIREAVALGFIKITRRGRAGNAEFRQATWYQTTFLNNTDHELLTHDWRSIRTLDQAKALAAEARKPQRAVRRPARRERLNDEEDRPTPRVRERLDDEDRQRERLDM